jgi:hypothetical protein
MAKDGIEQATKTGVTAVIGSFDKATQDAIAISESRIGVDHTGRQNIALFIFAKLNRSLYVDAFNFEQLRAGVGHGGPAGPFLSGHIE